MLKYAKLGHLDWVPQFWRSRSRITGYYRDPEEKKSCITSRRTINIIKILATGQQQHSHAYLITLPVRNGPGYSCQDHLGAESCETLRNIAILLNHTESDLDLTTRFLLPLEAGWGAVPLVGETCDQPGGICNRVVME